MMVNVKITYSLLFREGVDRTTTVVRRCGWGGGIWPLVFIPYRRKEAGSYVIDDNFLFKYSDSF